MMVDGYLQCLSQFASATPSKFFAQSRRQFKTILPEEVS